jgi:hypothetical protein
MPALRRTYEDYQIGIICALALEKAAVEAMLDEEHPRLKKKDHDVNDYTLGRIGVHNITIACLPAGLLGNGPAATVAKDIGAQLSNQVRSHGRHRRGRLEQES